jgi:hypothetical protein
MADDGRAAVQSVDGVYGGADAAEVMKAATAAAESDAKVNTESAAAAAAKEEAAGGQAADAAGESRAESAGVGTESAPESAGETAAGEGAAKVEVPEGFVPRARLETEIGKYKDRMRAAGVDPDTGKPLPKPVLGSGGAPLTDDAPNREYAAGAEPWREQLKPVPNPIEFEGTPEEYLAARDKALRDNWLAESKWRQDAAAQLNRVQTDAQATATAVMAEYQGTHIPAALRELNVTLEQFNERITTVPEVPMDNERASLTARWILSEVGYEPSGERRPGAPAVFLHAMAVALKTPAGVQQAAQVAALPERQYVAELRRMEARVMEGLPIFGSKGGATKSEGGGLTNPSGSGNPRTDAVRKASDPPSYVGSGKNPPKSVHDMQDDDAFFRERAKQDRTDKGRRKLR